MTPREQILFTLTWLCGGCAFDLPVLKTHPDALDGGMDASTPGGSEPDASSELAKERMAPFLGTSCDATEPVLLCDDFDTHPVDDKWWIRLAYSHEAAFIDAADYVSAGKSLVFKVAAGTYLPDDFTFAAAVYENRPDMFREVPTHVHASADFKVEAFDHRSGRMADLFKWYPCLAGFGVTEYVLQLVSRGERVAARFVERESPDDITAASVTEHEVDRKVELETHLEKWSHVTFDIDRIGEEDEGNFAKVTLNGQVIFEGPLTQPYHWYLPRLIIGLDNVRTSEATQEWKIRFDNVVLDIEAR